MNGFRPGLSVLGTAQDGGVPHPGCACPTCAAALGDPTARRLVAAVAVVGRTGSTLLVDATPDLAVQTFRLARTLGRPPPAVDALLLTHAHVGHYLGLAYLGREAMNVRGLPLFGTPRMLAFVEANLPWSHLVGRGNVRPVRLRPGEPLVHDGVEVLPFESPHRAEDTDTLGLALRGPNRTVVYLPDADRFPPDVADRIRRADVALVDGTFYDRQELPGRDLAEIPHPFVEESVQVLAGARGEVLFTHLNHSNRLIRPDSGDRPVLPSGFGVLAEGASFAL